MESFSAETNSTDLPSQPWYEPQIILSMVILSLTFLLGLPGNGLVLWVAGLKMQRTVNTVWFLHLTLADFLCCLSLPFSLAHLALQGHWPYGWLLCKLIPSIIVLNMFASVFLLTVISLDRCLLVLKPIWCQNHRNVGTAFTICGCIWVMAFVMCIPVFMYRETFTVGNHDMCGYDLGFYGSLDYSDFTIDLLENGSLDNSIVQLPGEMDARLQSFSERTNDLPWTATTIFHSQTFQRPSRQSLPIDPANLSSQRPYDNLFKPANEVSPIVPSGFPIEDHRANPLDLELYSDSSSNSSDLYELFQDFQGDYLGQFSYNNQVLTPRGAVTITRLVVGFLLPSFVMVACYSLIIFRMRRGRFTKTRIKTLKVAMAVVIVFCICWAPYHIVGVLSLFFDPETPLGEALLSWDHVCIALASANSCFNPFLYALLGKDFRKKARQSMKGILEAAFSEDLTHSTSCPQSKVFTERNSISTSV
ncbi:C3a anaphylatoxin chemotactic receptor [Panthera onca]|uniref:C3a anaphylatoxin chemotactic receptor n=1 Tax=Panthera leo TaxID=9689 RepID=A0A8C8WLT1_PANLE|nr:C3a anaphylatoxin chemotactic receptor [Panthera leo]XP_042804342.1 C3a anaphylatoxin chemotactic receptor [Panthera leo]XP_060514469.1 C3a anaphylatoxin chemotactic receptor [Panthera onca]XP_060514470.1 C3a anaphylatoxin chemotactic receptor [Panthera onca]